MDLRHRDGNLQIRVLHHTDGVGLVIIELKGNLPTRLQWLGYVEQGIFRATHSRTIQTDGTASEWQPMAVWGRVSKNFEELIKMGYEVVFPVENLVSSEAQQPSKEQDIQ